MELRIKIDAEVPKSKFFESEIVLEIKRHAFFFYSLKTLRIIATSDILSQNMCELEMKSS